MLYVSSPVIARALTFAIRKHAGQVRTSTLLPYIMHPVRVASTVLWYSGLRHEALHDAIVIALLHDTLEDTCTTYGELVYEFGVLKANGVRTLTKVKYDTQGMTLPRDIVFANKLRAVAQSSKKEQCVALADRIDNLNPYEPHPKLVSGVFTMYINQSQLLLDTIGHASAGLATLLQQHIAFARKVDIFATASR